MIRTLLHYKTIKNKLKRIELIEKKNKLELRLHTKK